MLFANFIWNWPSGSGEEDENVKSLGQQQLKQQQRRQTRDTLCSEKLTWAWVFASCELKTWYIKGMSCTCQDFLTIKHN